MTYWKLTYKILRGIISFWKYIILKSFVVLSGLNLKVIFTDLYIRQNFYSEKGLNEDKKCEMIAK